jgi:hypothetical protein
MAKRQRKNKPNATGRNQTSRFARLDHSLLESPAYRSLSPAARSLLVEMVMMDNGSNNGSLFLSVRDAAARIGVVDLTCATNAFGELQDMGFIAMTMEGHFSVKASGTSRARSWRLTNQAVKGKRGPTNEYLTREPAAQTAARARMERGLRVLKTYRRSIIENRMPVLDSNTLPPLNVEKAPEPVLDSHTAKSKTDAFPPNPTVLDSATHTAVTIGTGNSTLTGWWSNDQMNHATTWAALIMTLKRKALAA